MNSFLLSWILVLIFGDCFQTVSETGWNHFKISPQLDAPILVEAMRTVYGPVSSLTPSPDVEMAVDIPEVEEVAFTLVTNQKHKGKNKAPKDTSILVVSITKDLVRALE